MKSNADLKFLSVYANDDFKASLRKLSEQQEASVFRVDSEVEARQLKIRGFMHSGEHFVAVLLAAVDFERTVRRAIISLGVTPTKELAMKLGRRERGLGKSVSVDVRSRYGASLDGYRKAWRDEIVVGRKLDTGLNDVIPHVERLEKAINLRHELVHGDSGVVGAKHAETQVEIMMEATRAIDAFARQHGVDLTKRIKVRRKHRNPNK